MPPRPPGAFSQALWRLDPPINNTACDPLGLSLLYNVLSGER